MVVLGWLLKVLVFFVVLKVAQVVFWNVRRSFYIHPWLIELIVGILVVVAIETWAVNWWTIIVLGVLVGIIRGDQEEDTSQKRQLL